MASTYLTRTTGTSTLNTKCTFSGWYKRSILGTYQHIFSVGDTSGAQLRGRFRDTDTFQLYANITGQGEIQYITNRVFRDVNSWYHILISIDCTQSAANRVKIYVNGIEETSFDGTTQAEITSITLLNSQPFQIGRRAQTADTYFDGSISHFHFIDGTAYDASAFGETDTTTGEWKAKTSPSVTYGNNGFFILKDGNGITDQSGEGNNFTLGGGTLTDLKDNPDNVFATWNPLGMNRDVTFSNGNCTATYGTSGTRDIVISTLGAVSGKYYWEIEMQGSNADNGVIGVSLSDWNTGYAVAGETNYAWGLRGYDGAVHNNNSSVGGTWATFTAGDKIGVAVNLDNEQGGLNKLYFSKNGTWLNGADPSNLTSVTGVVGITKPENGNTGFLFPVISDAGSNATPQFKANFGNGYFGTTAITTNSGNGYSGAEGSSKFNYTVPTGYSALSTKGLNE